MTPLRQENCCMVTKWEHWGSPREAICIFSILSSIYSRPCCPWRTHLTLMQLLYPVHHFEHERESVSEAKGKALANLGWGEQTEQDCPSVIREEAEHPKVGEFLRQQNVPLPTCEPCCVSLEVSGCGSASPGVCVKGTGKLSQEDGLEQACTSVGVCHSAFWDTSRPGFFTYQHRPFFILLPHTSTLFIFL